MKGKITWLTVSSLMVLSLVIAACAPAVVEKPEVTEKPTPEVITEKPEVVEPVVERPRYGGTLVIGKTEGPVAFQVADRRISREWPLQSSTHERISYRPWETGPAGTGEWETNGVQVWPGHDYGHLAESWEVIGDDTLIIHVRKGVHFALDPTSEASRLVGGRQFTAEDMVWNLRDTWKPGSRIAQGYPYLADMENRENSIYLHPDNPWAVVMKSVPGVIGALWERGMTAAHMFAPEVYEKYGVITKPWQAVGTGPFIMKDYVVDSSLTYVRNPNYWKHNPLYPDDQLPYIDGFKILIIPDTSTQMAALRTGKIAYMEETYDWEMAQQLLKTNPELKWRQILSGGQEIDIRTDRPDLPFKDRRVRLALSMAINRQEMIEHLYGGQAAIANYIVPFKEWSHLVTPIEEMPPSVREQYEYNPEKAKQLLAEAGYPNGFKTEILITAKDVDTVAVYNAYWAQIGVDLQLTVVESAVQAALTNVQGKFPELSWGTITPTRELKLRNYEPDADSNLSFADEPWVTDYLKKYYSVDSYFNPGKMGQVTREAVLRVLEPVWYIYGVAPHEFALWQPWVKHYYGGRISNQANYFDVAHLWIDQELKKEMGH